MLVPIVSSEELADFIYKSGAGRCFSMVVLKNGRLYFIEYHGCGEQPEVIDIADWSTNASQLVS